MSRITAVTLILCFKKQRAWTAIDLARQCQTSEPSVKVWLYIFKKFGLVSRQEGAVPGSGRKRHLWTWLDWPAPT